MAPEEREPNAEEALRDLQRAAQRREELADAYQRKAQKCRAEAREFRRLATRLTQSLAGDNGGGTG